MRRWRIVLWMVLLLGTPVGVLAQSADLNQAGLVVQFGDGTVATYCVEFSEPSISGHEALARAGFTLSAEYSALGAAVCKIENDGCQFPFDICFCQCNGTPCTYWAYHHLVDGEWHYSGFGASSYKLQHGEVDGWAWGEGSMSFGAQPPLIEFDQICIQPEPTAAPTPDDGTSISGAAVAEAGKNQTLAAVEDQSGTHSGGVVTTTASLAIPLVGYAGLGIIVVGLAAWLMIANGRENHG